MKFKKIIIYLIIVALLTTPQVSHAAALAPIVLAGAGTAAAAGIASWLSSVEIGKIAADVIWKISAWISDLLLMMSSWFLWATGGLFNLALNFTVVEMRDNLASLSAPGGGLAVAWGALRDLANIAFIFILLYAAVITILNMGGGRTQRIIRNVIILALLVNFSLFFTRIIIDVSNALTTAFYNRVLITEGIDPSDPLARQNQGISGAFMSRLKLSSVYDDRDVAVADADEPDKATAIINTMGSVFFVIAGFVFLAAAGFFIARYIILIILMILSPLAFAAMALPNDRYSGQWWQALWDQVLFAPAFMILLWVSLLVVEGASRVAVGDPSLASVIAGGVGAQGKVVAEPGAINLVLNYVIAIGLLIASLIVAKKLSGSAGAGMRRWTGAVVGGAVIGGTAAGLRRVVGGAAAGSLADEKLKERASREGPAGTAARLELRAAQRLSKASFDVRSVKTAGVGTAISKDLELGKGGGKGGFEAYEKAKTKEATEFAKTLAPSAVAIDQAEQRLDNARSPEERAAAQRELGRLKGVSAKDAAKRNDEVKKAREKRVETEMKSRRETIEKGVATEKITETGELRSVRSGLAGAREKLSRSPLVGPEREQIQKDIASLEQKEKETVGKIRKERVEGLVEQAKAAVEASIPQVEKILEQPSLATTRQRAYAGRVEKGFIPTPGRLVEFTTRRERAAAFRKEGKGKDAKQKAKDALKAYEEEGGAEEKEKATTPATPETPGGTSPAGGGTTTTT